VSSFRLAAALTTALVLGAAAPAAAQLTDVPLGGRLDDDPAARR